ncbi:hypothetical protein P7C70_g8087, partial [Phenoliferia sp. Uapishka_3]
MVANYHTRSRAPAAHVASGSPTYRRAAPASLDRFFSSRMRQPGENSIEIPLPSLVPSNGDSDSDSSDDDHEPELDAPPHLLNFSAANRYIPLIFPALSPYASPQKSTQVTPPPVPAQSQKVENYSIPVHLDALDSDDSRYAAIPLTRLDSRPPLTTVALPPTPCVSCGLGHLQQTPALAFIVLDTCEHVLCSKCLAMLVNATSNEPPRQGDCFACQLKITGFKGVEFVDSDPIASGKGPSVATSSRLPATPVRSAKQPFFNEPKTIPGLSPFRNLVWSDVSVPSTPQASPRSTFGSTSSSPKASLMPTAWPVVRVDNIPWDLSIYDVLDWIPASVPRIPAEDHALSIHILCNRIDCRTLNMCYIELPTLAAAHALIRLKNAKLICGRPISVVLSSQTELLEQIFPAWAPGFDGIDAAAPEEEGVLVTAGDIDGLVELCELKLPHAIKAPERPFLQLATILVKLPWHQPEVFSLKLCVRILRAVQSAISLLVAGSELVLENNLGAKLLQILIEASIACPGLEFTFRAAGLADTRPPGFRESDKTKLQIAAGFESQFTSPVGAFSS